MEKLIIIKYGELSTKKENINLFLNVLKKNIRYTLGDLPKIYYDRGRMYIETDNFDMTLNKLKKVFGIHAYLIAYKMDTDIETIKNNILELVRDMSFKT